MQLSVAIGVDRDFPLRANGPDRKPATGLLATDSLSAVVWAGDNFAPLFAPAVAWVNAPAAAYKLTIAAAQTRGLESGTYRYQVQISRNGRAGLLADGYLELTDSPGLQAPPPVYCGAEDVRDLLPFGHQFDGPNAAAGFIKQRGEARAWIDEAIIANGPVGAVGQFGAHSTAIFAWNGGGPGRSEWLRLLLAGDKLMRRPRLKELAATYAAARVCRAALPSKADDPIVKRGQSLLMEANAMISTFLAEFDLDGDGSADYSINMGITRPGMA